MVTQLVTRKEVDQARLLVENNGLSFEPEVDDLVGAFEEGRLAGVGARRGNILKMLVIRPDLQHGSLLGELVTELIRSGSRAGIETFFVFTRPENAASFRALNFAPLATRPAAVLLEYGEGIATYLGRHRDRVRPGTNGAVVANCNPFTLGHRYLVEEAACRVDTLYLFVVREERSAFPFADRLRLVREGTQDLKNVIVLDSSHYAVSAVTFPAYFLKAEESAARLQMEIDLTLFGRHIAPFFSIARRFVAAEPHCRTTRLYNETMQDILPPYGVEAVVMKRKMLNGEPISASQVRRAIRREAFESVRRMVPAPTFDFIMSEAGRAVRRRLSGQERRH
ncbi:MAG: [citrate (pro-3S)-lyase] ligase [Desulfuromonas sp.]|uniref:[citrate (pro-3S)-lyase] ligase n=1 Tax=Desulfuromonas sp. TaxID=892 RepID=UPI000CBFCB36|nr:[citrate (pro-3S)-lyase] ligase [Desulfuromonas sp.]PLX86044.1 MAG: [citrate (pro-3S)-lyase] ligase [Desulfuromonas sp.]